MLRLSRLPWRLRYQEAVLSLRRLHHQSVRMDCAGVPPVPHHEAFQKPHQSGFQLQQRVLGLAQVVGLGQELGLAFPELVPLVRRDPLLRLSLLLQVRLWR